MRIAGIEKNDIANGPGICVSIWFQGCPHHCEGCFNSETWDFDGGYEIASDIMISQTLEALNANGVRRNLSILGGEPLCEQNRADVAYLLAHIRAAQSETPICVWTGYTWEQLQQMRKDYHSIELILKNATYIIEGPFILAQRDVSLKWRGSSNQHIWHQIDGKWKMEEE